MNLLILLYIDHPSEVPEKLIQDRFRKLSCFPEAFSSIHYKGTRTYNPPTDFSGLRRAVEQQLENNTTRSPRQPGVIYKALKVSEEEFVTVFICSTVAINSAAALKGRATEPMIQTCMQVFHENDDSVQKLGRLSSLVVLFNFKTSTLVNTMVKKS